MINLLIRVAVFLAEAAVGIFVASLVVQGFSIAPGGFMVAVVVFAVIQTLAAKGVGALSKKYAPGLLMLVGLASTLIALFVASRFDGGITITGIWAWVLSTLIVWAVSAIVSWALRTFLTKETSRS